MTMARFVSLLLLPSLSMECEVCGTSLTLAEDLTLHYARHHSTAPVPAAVKMQHMTHQYRLKRVPVTLLMLERVISKAGASRVPLDSPEKDRAGPAAAQHGGASALAAVPTPADGRAAYAQEQLDLHMDERLPGCRNSSNPFHLCTSFCDLRYDAAALMGYMAPEMLELESLKMLKLQLDVEDDPALRKQLRFKVCAGGAGTTAEGTRARQGRRTSQGRRWRGHVLGKDEGRARDEGRVKERRTSQGTKDESRAKDKPRTKDGQG